MFRVYHHLSAARLRVQAEGNQRRKHMQDRQFSASSLAASFGWTVAVGVWLVSWIVNESHLGQFAIILALAAATATVRMFFIGQSRRMRAASQMIIECCSTEDLPSKVRTLTRY
jgi:predicted MFS family arabinose efflux permease